MLLVNLDCTIGPRAYDPSIGDKLGNVTHCAESARRDWSQRTCWVVARKPATASSRTTAVYCIDYDHEWLVTRPDSTGYPRVGVRARDYRIRFAPRSPASTANLKPLLTCHITSHWASVRLSNHASPQSALVRVAYTYALSINTFLISWQRLRSVFLNDSFRSLDRHVLQSKPSRCGIGQQTVSFAETCM